MRYELDLYTTHKSTDRRVDIDLMVLDREDGQAATKFKRIAVAFLIGDDGNITLLSDTKITVRPFGTPDSD